MTRPAQSRSSARTAAEDEPGDARAAAGGAGLPGIRTLHSPLFRTSLAGTLLLIGALLLTMLLARQAGQADGQFAFDFRAYFIAAERMAAGESPYAPEMLAGPFDAQGQDLYLYPPWLGQLLRPVTGVALEAAAALWLVLQVAAMVLALWVGTGIGGAPRSLERLLWCGVATVYFLPAFDTLWKGNVSGFLALIGAVAALGGVAAGIGASFGALLKAVPVTLVPLALVADRRSRGAMVLGLAAGLAISFALAPGAWLEYPVVLRNLIAGPSEHLNNLAPAAVAARLGLSDPAADLVRLASLALAVVSVAASIVLARDREGLPAAALLAVVALLLVPGSLWFHYLVILLPFAAMAWMRASGPQRGSLFVSAALVTVSLLWLPLALAGATLMAVQSLVLLRPMRRPGLTR